MKLLNPNIRIETPVNWMTDSRSLSKSLIKYGNMGARDSGANPWVNVIQDTAVIVDHFQNLVQFRGS